MTTSARHCPRVIAATDDGQALIVCGKPRPCPDHHAGPVGVTVPVAGGLVEFPADLTVRVALDAIQGDAALAHAGAAFARLQAAADGAVGRNLRHLRRHASEHRIPPMFRYCLLTLAYLGEATLEAILAEANPHARDDNEVLDADVRWLGLNMFHLAAVGVVEHKQGVDNEELWRIVTP